MKRRDFLKLIGIAPLAPSVLAAKESIAPLLKTTKKFLGADRHRWYCVGCVHLEECQGSALEGDGWLPDCASGGPYRVIDYTEPSGDYQYLHITCDPAIQGESSCVVTYYALGPDGKYEKIDEWESPLWEPSFTPRKGIL